MRDRIAGVGLATVFVLLAIVLLLVERAPPIVCAVALLFAAAGTRLPVLRLQIRSSPVLWAGAALVAWLLLSASWSIAGSEAMSNGLRIAAMVIAAIVLPALCLTQSQQTQDLAARWALIASCLVLVLLLIETLFDMPLLRTARYYVNGELFVNGLPPLEERRTDVTYFQELYLANRLSHIASIAAILVLPIAGILWQRGQRLGAVAALAVGCAGVALVPTQTPMLALVLGLAVGLIMLIPKIGQSRRLGVALAALVAVGVVTSPWLAQTAYTAVHDALSSSDISIIHRVAIWDYAAGFIAERPIAGYGIEAARTLGREGANLAELVPGHPYAFQALPLHPHNASIQIWLELGGVGALIFALFLFAMTRTVHAYADQPVARAALMAGLVVGLAVAHLSYGIWQYWWVASLGMIYAMLALIFASERTS